MSRRQNSKLLIRNIKKNKRQNKTGRNRFFQDLISIKDQVEQVVHQTKHQAARLLVVKINQMPVHLKVVPLLKAIKQVYLNQVQLLRVKNEYII